MAPIDPITITLAAVNKVSPVIGTISDDLGRLTQQLTSVRGWYELLIKQNEQLQASLLSTAATLSGTNKIIQNGIEIKDPTATLKALEAPVNEAVQRIREGSLELVGVTSAELIPLLQIVTGQASQIGADLNEAADLTLDFSAAFQVLQLPIYQARQEITSILGSSIDMNSSLAKSLNITNAQVNTWKAQGVLVERLRERLEAFRASNLVASKTIQGSTSNIAELFETMTQKAGAPLLEPITDGLAAVYEFLKANEGSIRGFFTSVSDFILDFSERAVEAFKTLYPAISELSAVLLQILGTAAGESGKNLLILADIVVNLTKAIAPLLGVVANITEVIADLISSDVGTLIVQAGLLTAAFIALAPATVTAVTALAALPALITGITASLPALITGLGAFGVAATAAIAPLLPIIALGGAVSLTLMIKQTGDLKLVNDEIDEFSRQSQELGDRAIDIATKLKNLNDIKEKDGKLTAEQTEQLKRYKIGASGLIAGLQSQNQSLKELQPANESQKNAINAMIAGNEKLIGSLSKQSGGVELQARDLTKLGNTYKQLEDKASAAMRIIAEGGGGDQAKFQAATKEIVDLTKQQVELGAISRAEAVNRLIKVRDDARTEVGVQQAAQKAITDIRKIEIDNQVKAIDQRIQAA